MNLKTTNLSLTIPPLPFDVEFLPPDTCLVGGVVRDAFLGRKGSYLDLDFVVPENSIETANRIARHYDGGFVVLDRERQIARVVFPHATLDFALQEGDCLETDLKRRDFTINAIAYDVREQKIIDPLEIEIENLSGDPFDDELLGDFQAYLEDCRHYLQLAQQKFAAYPNPAQLARVAANLYYCLDRIEDGIKELEYFVLNYDEYYLHTGQEILRIAERLRCEAEEELRACC